MLLGLLAAGSVMVLSSTAMAVTGNCVTCHTIHDSQDGNDLGTTGQNDNLLIGSATETGCMVCHSGTQPAEPNGSLANAPRVYDSGGTVATLAGGGFGAVYGTGGADANGHNVSDIGGADVALGTTPPGGGAAGQVSCASCHTGLAHHNDSTGKVVGTATTGYRFIADLSGIEDDDFEYETALDRNVYLADGTAASINSFCGGCHGNFHVNGGVGGPHTRHPVGIDVNDGTLPAEYGGYSFTTTVPVGVNSAVFGGGLFVDSTDHVPGNVGEGLVACTSCHRAHGSDQPDALRFVYNMNAGGGTSSAGCFACHTTKDDGV